MKQVIIKRGKAYSEEIPAPKVSKNTLFVQVYSSCISIGTEISDVVSSGESLLKRALRQPEKVHEMLKNVKNEGFSRTAQKVRGKIKAGLQTGYSSAGKVLDVGSNIKDIKVGDNVACAGAGFANHAEYIEVPRNLLVNKPKEVDFDEASTVTLGAIAMQGIRRSDVSLGEYVAVIGLGVLGQIVAQLLKANGCRVFGIDLDERRIQKALELGLEKGVNSLNEDVVNSAINFSGGFGLDRVIITAATHSKKPLAQAFQMSRKKGRVVLVGSVGMEINRDDMYKKELDFLISTSYGPGRYDESYEQKGHSYPYPYVRWTETRNMEEYLRLISEKKINIKPLIEKTYKIEDASVAYEDLNKGSEKPLIALFKYDRKKEEQLIRKIEIKSEPSKKNGRINLAVVGAGEFAKAVQFPNLIKLKTYYNLRAVVDKVGYNAKSTAQQFGASYATTDYRQVLSDKNIDAVMIATRHDLHAEMAIKALKADKAVFIEKPMAVNKEELDKLIDAINETKKPFMVGFNRRFSRYAREVKKHISNRINPMIIDYQMNAGYLPLDHWVYTDEGGGRIIGEACHIFDLFNNFTEAKVESVSVDKITPRTKSFSPQDNVIITLKYCDGSICSLIYTALGNNKYPKEVCYIYFDGKVIIMNDYKKLEGYGLKLKEMKSNEQDKGQFEELIEYAKYLKGEILPPIPLWQLVQATEISFRVER